MPSTGLLIDSALCCGCHSCEVACQQEHGHTGMVVQQRGPRERDEGGWEFDFVPGPTERCNLCQPRTRAHRSPSCVAHCPGGCLGFLDGEGAIERANERAATTRGLTVFRR